MSNVQETLKAAEKLIVKAIMFEREAEQYLSESNYELNGCLGDSAADINVNGKAVLAKVRNALAEIESETSSQPVAWKYKTNKVHTWITEVKPPDDAYDDGTLTPLYTSPQPAQFGAEYMEGFNAGKMFAELEQPKEWVSLSDDEIFALCPYIDHDLLEEAFYRGARAIEAKLKELNT